METAIGIGAATLAVASAVIGGLAFPRARGSVELPESTCEGHEGRRVLVAYSSQFGTTGEIARAVAARLCRDGSSADAKPIQAVGDLTPYDTVVVGAPIQYDRWMREARDFVVRNEDFLSSIPVAYFFACAALSDTSGRGADKAAQYAERVAATSPHVEPVSVGRFAGVVDFDRMGLLTRIALRAVLTLVGATQGDYRNWQAIRAWSDEVDERTTNKANSRQSSQK